MKSGADAKRDGSPMAAARPALAIVRTALPGDPHARRAFGSTYTLAFSRLLYPREILVAYNASDQAR
jgi:hypothetical protein